MLSIRILALGKIKEAYLREGVAEYAKRFTTLAHLEIIELADEKVPDRPSTAIIERIKEVEGQRLINAIHTDEYVITLDAQGIQLSSQQLADKIAQLTLNGFSKLSFIIGASYGLSAQVLRRANFCFSCGALTFPHQLMRLILIEQLYRACKINRGETYHK
ncbi:MAG: 23S rRNA (pseudouridine(1915)-N(3))-methyltransferase RlmH [Firmicutes bacterium]|nr:23S rRNA (pseudouridine(1915)-N(3))-methyltransferase RlmH [Bacillota bacterium]